ncbi:isochorismate synthase MenF [Actinobacillus pleuropneumoniae]|uniref:isochorismate synthase n=1 Tax=Actinobacillus pleuropneumoniae TaxID=715 RepID=UPI001EEF400C|nr:isochorismate synthase [Actinobacillus pleuropneumoniae]UKH22743.1 isochorismate synthase [Actinobacillus pleuropneumoniae]USQ15698.1 isochorismate synthase [Actinobacillus pleuropneumoniae]
MSIFNQLKQQLSKQLIESGTHFGLMEYQAEVALSEENIALLSWLKAQNHYPHFFWQARETDQTIASIGAVRSFFSVDEAQQFVKQTQFGLVGGVRFEGGCQFILPRLLLVKNQQNLTAYFYLNEAELAQQAVIFERFFANFCQTLLLELTENNLLAQTSVYDFDGWQQNIERAISHIQQKDFNKVVLANAKTLQFENELSAYDLLAASQTTNLGCYHFIWAENVESAFVGSSPERLYHRKGNQFHTEALAGTAPVTESMVQTELNAQWLLTDPKNIYENQLVVDDIQAQLTDCVTELQISQAEIKRLHNVQHLRRKISAVLKPEMSDADCLARMHPTAAVAGLPRQAAKQFIAEYEQFTRCWYAGTLGYLQPDEAEFCVALRSAQIERNRITLYAGAGIVEESEPQSEWQEIERKSLALAKLLKVD